MKKCGVVAWSLLFCSVLSAAQEPIVYPAQGQSAQKMEKDKYACYSWAKGEMGFDPMQNHGVSIPAPEPSTQAGGKSNIGRCIVRGAAVGGLAGSMSPLI